MVIFHRICSYLSPLSFFWGWALFGRVPFSWFAVHSFVIVSGWVSCSQQSSAADQVSPCRPYIAWSCGLYTCKVPLASSSCSCALLLRGHVWQHFLSLPVWHSLLSSSSLLLLVWVSLYHLQFFSVCVEISRFNIERRETV